MYFLSLRLEWVKERGGAPTWFQSLFVLLLLHPALISVSLFSAVAMSVWKHWSFIAFVLSNMMYTTIRSYLSIAWLESGHNLQDKWVRWIRDDVYSSLISVWYALLSSSISWRRRSITRSVYSTPREVSRTNCLGNDRFQYFLYTVQLCFSLFSSLHWNAQKHYISWDLGRQNLKYSLSFRYARGFDAARRHSSAYSLKYGVNNKKR